MKLEIGFPIMENWIIIRSGLCSEGKQIDIFFCLLLFKVWWSLGSVLRTTPSLSCAKKILEHDFNTSVYTHSHGSLMFFVRPYCLKMTWVELREEGRTIFVGHTKKVHFSDTNKLIIFFAPDSPLVWEYWVTSCSS